MKKSHKLPPAGVEAILNLSAQGCSTAEIINHLNKNFGVLISERMVRYYRRIHRKEILTTIDDEIAVARATYPEGAFLVGRLAKLEQALDREFQKKEISGIAIAKLISEERKAEYQVQLLAIRLRELEAKHPTQTDNTKEKILQELVRRSRNFE